MIRGHGVRLCAGTIVLAFLLASHARAQTAWPEDCKLHRIASFPMTVKGGHILVPVSVNGQQKMFIVDTGGYATSITQNAAAALDLPARRTHSHMGRDIGGKYEDSYVIASTFELGRMQAKDFDLLVMNANDMADGLLAPDLLRNFDVEFDFEAMTLNLFRPHSCQDRAVYWTDKYIALPITAAQVVHVRVPVTLEGKDMRAILDTGAPFSTMSLLSAGHFFDISRASPGIAPVGAIRGVSGGQLATYAYPFKTLTMGGVAVANPRILLTDSDNFLGSNDASLLLGLDIMRRLHMYFAYHESMLYISVADAH
jgi:predicted aspartyl protease